MKNGKPQNLRFFSVLTHKVGVKNIAIELSIVGIDLFNRVTSDYRNHS